MSVETVIFLNLGFYLAGFILLFGLRSGILQFFSGWISLSINLIGLMFSLALFFSINTPEFFSYHWIKTGNVNIDLDILVNKQTTFMYFIVQIVSLLVQVFSTKYMKDDFLTRFLSFINLFVFSMLGIIVSGNLFMIFIFWELVGLSSYLLIGFYFSKPLANVASLKAFLMNKIGDAGFMIGIILILVIFKTLNISQLHEIVGAYNGNFDDLKIFTGINGNTLITIIGILICCGAFAKSAQFPFQTWLIDAMEGPTPSSALIHAATMVVAGVFLLVRVQFIFTSDVKMVIAIIGTVTAFLAALSALVQFDIKKVLAYSTLSQIGYMYAGIGIDASGAALFHLSTHAFFKAGLFLCAGAIIDFMHHEQDMRKMGGLRHKLPIVFVCYSIFAASLAGLPFFSGFLSKDSIVLSSVTWAEKSGNQYYFIIPVVLIITAILTAYYIMRQLVLVFLDRKENLFSEIWQGLQQTLKGFYKASKDLLNAENQTLGEDKLINFMRSIGSYEFSMMILAFCSFGFLFSTSLFNYESSWFFKNFIIPESNYHWLAYVISLCSLIVIIIAFIVTKSEIGTFKESANPSLFKKILYHNYYLDRFYDFMFVKPLVGKLNEDTLSGKMKPNDRGIAHFLAKFDLKIVDGCVNALSRLTLILAMITSYLDAKFIDGIINGIYKVVYLIGKYLRRIQGGQIQLYLLSLMLLLAIILGFRYIINTI